MLINTVRLYERIQLGLRDPDPDVRACAESCLSYLVIHLKAEQIVMPDHMVTRLDRLPIKRIAA